MEKRCILDLPDDNKKKIAEILDSPDSPNWKTLITTVIRCHIAAYNDRFVLKLGMEVLSPRGSPSLKLLNDLGQRGRTVGELIGWIREMGDSTGAQTVLNLLSGSVGSLVITKDVEKEVTGVVGGQVILLCEASGPEPLVFQWFKSSELLVGQTRNTLHLQNLRQEDESYYTCRVALAKSLRYVFTGWAKVIVQQGSANLNFPIITCEPVPIVVLPHQGILRLYCDGVGRPAPSFQWFKNDTPIPGASERELRKHIISIEDQGVYFCKVFNDVGETVSRSSTVTLESDVSIRGPGKELLPGDRVSNKVALLIGNKDYRDSDLGQLYHPINDVCDLAGSLLRDRDGFKVVSLVNLTLKEMREALRQFCQLLVEDTYAVFYFAGHGFELGGLSYLMPVDASRSYDARENMAASEVLVAMQGTYAKLLVVMLDCCRTEPFREGNPVPGGDLQVKKPNVVVAYGCCSKTCVFECKSERNGFFAKHLLKNIGKDKSIDEVLMDVSRGISQENLIDPTTQEQQIVNRISTSVKGMSLWSPVDNSSVDVSTAISTTRWKSAHEIPNEPVTVFQENHVRVELIFSAEVSNVLIVNARTLAEDQLDCAVTFDVLNIVSGCSVEQDSRLEKKSFTRKPSEATLKVKDLQRLQEPLVLQLKVMYTLNGERCIKPISYTMEDKPLYSKLVTQW